MSHLGLESWTVADYERAAEEYFQALPPEHFMEATRQAYQREITVESFALVRAHRRDLHVFNELLVQYPLNAHLGQVVPDNMLILSAAPIDHTRSYNLPFEPARPFCVLEYVSETNKRKDYHDNLRKYEQELKVPYYLLFDPETKDLRLHRHNGIAYELVAPNAQGRLALPELELEVGVLGGWTRFWFRGQLLPLPAELLQKLVEAEKRADDEKRRADDEKRRADDEKRRADDEKRRADEAEKLIGEETRRADEEKRRADDAARQTEEERKRVADLQAALERAQALLRQLQAQASVEEPPAD
ncbi:MAG: Uma2 family endonuclease [Planctomycetes bacterium]|nr:Uma2 family endonuclease [Planctomycetota bacterium]